MNFSELILHPTSHRQLENYLKDPTHALLLTGENGVGLKTIAKTLAKEIAGNSVALIEPTLHEKQKTRIINADDMRDLFELTRSRRNSNFVILIDDVDLSAAGVFERILKFLEEPIANVYYILTSHRPQNLPATILSRAQTIEILPPPEKLCEEFIARHFGPEQKSSESTSHAELSLFRERKISEQAMNDKILKPTAAKLNQIKFLANRKPAEIHSLLTDEEYFRQRAGSMNTAKNFVQGKTIDRLKIVAETAAGKSARTAAIDLIKNISQLLLLTMPRSKNPESTAAKLELIAETIDNLHQNGNVRAQLTNLALNV